MKQTNPTVVKHAWLGLIVVLIICVALYWPSLHGPFLFDDFPNLGALTSIDHVSSWRDLGIYLSQPRDFPGRPLAMLSFLLQRQDWPDSPFPFKLVNLGLHLACGCLVFLLTKRLSQTFSGERAESHRPAMHDFAGLLAAAAWLLNPMSLSGVVLVVQRMTLLMALFTLLGLLAYVRGVVRSDTAIRQRATWIALGLGVCTLLSFLSKENGILLPLYALALDATVLRSATSRLPRSLQWFRRLFIWPTVLFIVGYLFHAGFHAWGPSGIRDFTLGERLLTEPRVLASYIGNTFFPRFGVYGLYHDDFTVSHGLLSPISTTLCLILLVGLLILAFLSMKRRPLLAMAILWYLGGQIIESSSIMLELYFEHRNYVPLIGVMMAIGIAITRLDSYPRKKSVYLAYGAWLVASSLATALSARVYASENLLATAWAGAQPASARAQGYLAGRLASSGRLDQALKVITQVQAQHPQYAGLEANRIYLLCRLGTLGVGELDAFDNLLRTAPFDRSAAENMGTLRELAHSGQCPALDDARWKNSVDIMLSNAAYRDYGVSNGFLHYQKHFWAVQRGDLDMAISELDAAYRADPDANIPRLQANYLVSAGLPSQAMDILRDTDTSRLPLLRRLLVDDKAINAKAIADIQNKP